MLFLSLQMPFLYLQILYLPYVFANSFSHTKISANGLFLTHWIVPELKLAGALMCARSCSLSALSHARIPKQLESPCQMQINMGRAIFAFRIAGRCWKSRAHALNEWLLGIVEMHWNSRSSKWCVEKREIPVISLIQPVKSHRTNAYHHFIQIRLPHILDKLTICLLEVALWSFSTHLDYH